MSCRLASVAFIVTLSAFASGCATVTQGSKQIVNLHTDPPGATCDVAREARAITSLAATPGLVQVGREWGAIDISCRKQGHQSAELRVESTVEAWTMGNILLGGIIGFAVDAASGAMRQYPESVTLTLVPEDFASLEERDRYARERLAQYEKEAAAAAEKLAARCSPDVCPSDYQALQEAKDRRGALLNERLGKVRIREATAPAKAPEFIPAAASSGGN